MFLFLKDFRIWIKEPDPESLKMNRRIRIQIKWTRIHNLATYFPFTKGRNMMAQNLNKL